MLLLPMLVLACASEVNIYYSMLACTDVDKGELGVSQIVMEKQPGQVVVYRTQDYQFCSSVFAPDIEVTGHKIYVHEYWEVTPGDDCEMCFAPQVIIEDPPAGDWTLGWFEEDASDPIDIVEFTVE